MFPLVTMDISQKYSSYLFLSREIRKVLEMHIAKIIAAGHSRGPSGKYWTGPEVKSESYGAT
jgi:hypothetical protein